MLNECVCKWFDHDTLVIDKACLSNDHGGIQRRLRYLKKRILNEGYGPFGTISKKLYPVVSSDAKNR